MIGSMDPTGELSVTPRKHMPVCMTQLFSCGQPSQQVVQATNPLFPTFQRATAGTGLGSPDPEYLSACHCWRRTFFKVSGLNVYDPAAAPAALALHAIAYAPMCACHCWRRARTTWLG
eukprot:1143433-Pelagomonas_calceolata.AAC.1